MIVKNGGTILLAATGSPLLVPTSARSSLGRCGTPRPDGTLVMPPLTSHHLRAEGRTISQPVATVLYTSVPDPEATCVNLARGIPAPAERALSTRATRAAGRPATLRHAALADTRGAAARELRSTPSALEAPDVRGFETTGAPLARSAFVRTAWCSQLHSARKQKIWSAVGNAEGLTFVCCVVCDFNDAGALCMQTRIGWRARVRTPEPSVASPTLASAATGAASTVARARTAVSSARATAKGRDSAGASESAARGEWPRASWRPRRAEVGACRGRY